MKKKAFFKIVSNKSADVTFLLVIAACSGEETTTEPEETAAEEASDATADAPIESESVKLVLNWFPKAQHGGVYAAQEDGVFEKNGLDVTVEPGGPTVSSVQIVASGQAQFGLAHADQLVIARNQGIELVAVATALQGSPQALMFHEGVEINDFEDLNGRDIFIQPGITYWDFLKSKYDLSDVSELAYTGQHVNFIDEKESVTQAFVTSEPFFLEKDGIKTQTLLISESGYDPYNVVLFVTKDYLEKNKETVQKAVTSFVEGWNLYKETPDSVNESIHVANPNIALDEIKFEQETQSEFVYGGDAKENGVGYMTEDRWSTLISQLLELELLEEEFEATDIFTTEFLLGN